MNASDQDIENLFKQSMDEHVLEPDFDQLQDFEIRLEKMRFTQFGWKHFNVYHTVAIIACLGLTVFNTLYSVIKDPDRQEFVQVYSDSIYIGQDKEEEVIQGSTRKKVSDHVKEQIGVSQDQTDSISGQPSDSLHLLKTVIVDPSVHSNALVKRDSVMLEKPVKKKKKSIYIQKRDTIVLYDTTKVIRKK